MYKHKLCVEELSEDISYFFSFEKTFFKVSVQNFCYHDVMSLS